MHDVVININRAIFFLLITIVFGVHDPRDQGYRLPQTASVEKQWVHESCKIVALGRSMVGYTYKVLGSSF